MVDELLLKHRECSRRWVREVEEVILLDEGTRGVGEEVV